VYQKNGWRRPEIKIRQTLQNLNLKLTMNVPDAASAAQKAVVTDKKPQMCMSTALRAYIAEVLTVQLENPDESAAAEGISLMHVLEKGKRGRTNSILALIKFLENSENPLVFNKKSPAAGTVQEWIDSSIKIGREELERQTRDAEAGRNSADEEISADAVAWAYLLKSYDESKVEGAKITRCTRYNRVPDHLKDSGICLLKCDTAFLPGSVGVGAGKEDLAAALLVVQGKKKDALARSAEESVAGADASEEGKTREHLYPNKRGKSDDDGPRKELVGSMQQLIALKSDKAIEQKHASNIERLNRQLELYLGFLSNPNLSDAMKTNFEQQILALQAQLADAFNPVPPKAPRKLATSFVTPPRSSSNNTGSSTSSSYASPLSASDGSPVAAAAGGAAAPGPAWAGPGAEAMP
jgi:hypothetical protein